MTTTAPFRVYDNIAESIEDHGKLLADQRLLHGGDGGQQ